MIDSATLASQTKVKLAAACRPCVSAPPADSATLTTQTPSQAPQSDNVLKCPVLSGPTDPAEQTNLSPDCHTTCEQIPSSPDRTLTTPQPPAVPQQDQLPTSDLHTLTARQSHPSALRKPCVDPNLQYLIDQAQRERQKLSRPRQSPTGHRIAI